MKRRQFFLHLFGMGFLLSDIKKAFSKSLSKFFLSGEADFLTVYPSSSGHRVQIPIFWRTQIPFISAVKFARAFNYNTYFNQEKRKLVIYLPQNKVVVSADNPFVILDSKPLHMPVSAEWRYGEIYIPIGYLVPLINKYSNVSFNYDDDRQVLRISQKRFSVAGMEIYSRDNGIVIRIRTSRQYKKSEMTIDERYNWLHVDLYNATADLSLLKRTPRTGTIREIKGFQFKELLSIGFRLSKMPLSKEIYQDSSTNDVIVILRYKEKLARSESRSEQGKNDRDIQQQLEEERQRWLLDTVIIDAGHGGKDPGAIGSRNLREKTVVLPIALKLGQLIEQKMPGVNVVYTRKKDHFIELRRRTQVANENHGKVFISIHANANRSKNISGFETYILGPEKGAQARNVVERENAVIQFEDATIQSHYQGINTILATMAQSAFMKQSEQLAARVQEELSKSLRRLNMNSRGVKQAPFWVMVGASMPCILVETGFITNSHDARVLKTGSHQQKIAEGIFTGLQRFKEEYESAI